MPSYEELLARVQPRVIHDDQEHERQLAEVLRLMQESDREPCDALLEMIDLLSTLIASYEERTMPTPEVTPEELLQHLREQQG